MWQIGHAPTARRCYGHFLPNFLWSERDCRCFACHRCSVMNIWWITYKISKIVDIIEVRQYFISCKYGDQQQPNFSDEVVFCPLSRRYVTLDLIGRRYWRSDLCAKFEMLACVNKYCNFFMEFIFGTYN